jgi:hypothetical protein
MLAASQPPFWHESSCEIAVGFMQKNLYVQTTTTGIVRIDRQTGVMNWEQDDVDPVLKQYAKKYLVDEGFLEQALGILDPLPDREVALFLDSLLPW